ncbi:hypothetical protein P152DRAFT_474579 [Eremomyces bilateralis CBS 781.70]|uniref:Maintenance of telomere capping protein 6 n=1 Tax=Eremomyces bilateralis CBS 781.70 TaxID=1392243 RepID=A0A6G1G024_9PEZI|nr:uncharacterized protein P152DRAFT_474579 [Eremomyces bilateralis CBS 781.70]KAF1811404.1 hypothetical protein P152DRAFT_474579 [Eremomyces bilateralis CBS 781.70]
METDTYFFNSPTVLETGHVSNDDQLANCCCHIAFADHMAPNKRGPWTSEEDSRLRCSIQKHVGYHPGYSSWPDYYRRLQIKDLKWTEIATHVVTRNAKQCRERWSQNLDPTLNHSPLNPEEEIRVDQLYRQYGTAWAKIARELGNRSDNLVKNYWNGKVNRYKRQESRTHSGTGHRRSASVAQYEMNHTQQQRLPAQLPHVAFEQQFESQYPAGAEQRPAVPNHTMRPQTLPSIVPQHSRGYTAQRPPPLNLAPSQNYVSSPYPSPTKQSGSDLYTPANSPSFQDYWSPSSQLSDRRGSLASHGSHGSHMSLPYPSHSAQPSKSEPPTLTPESLKECLHYPGPPTETMQQPVLPPPVPTTQSRTPNMQYQPTPTAVMTASPPLDPMLKLPPLLNILSGGNDDRLKLSHISERDLSLDIPINYLTKPGISLAAACFPDNQFLPSIGANCLSNLLASGFRRFIIDLYWDPPRQKWSLCPARLPSWKVDADAGGPTMPQSTARPSLSSVVLDGLMPESREGVERRGARGGEDGVVVRRQAVSSTSAGNGDDVQSPTTEPSRASSVSSVSSNGMVVEASAPPANPTRRLDPLTGEEVYRLGPYDCTGDLDLHLIGEVFSQYLWNTSNTLDASMSYLTLNIHAAATSDDFERTPSSVTGSNLPRANESLTATLNNNLSSFLYTPQTLERERRNLNASWWALPLASQPNWEYMTVEKTPTGIFTTPDGWPSEEIIVFQRAIRLLAEFGEIDPEMSDYDPAFDMDTVFPSNYLKSGRETSFDAAGMISSGCFFDSEDTSIAQVNNSWAVTADFPTTDLDSTQNTPYPLSPSISNLTICGISPLLNTALTNSTTASSPLPYQRLALSASWSWAPDSLDNDTVSLTDDPILPPFDNPASPLRCAVLSLTHSGHWLPADCATSHRSACRVSHAPYNWLVTSSLDPFDSAFSACDDLDRSAAFDVPRTGLENNYLYTAAEAATRAADLDEDIAGDAQVWLAFNSIDRADCWVVGGRNETCPYEGAEEETSQAVIVPVVASVIVFVVTALTVFVKCAANRRMKRRRGKRDVDGLGEYEGVPS